jgi:hypothetical protein
VPVRAGHPVSVTTSSLRDTDRLVYRFDADSAGAFWLARQLCERWLRERNVRTDAVCDLMLVATELCAAAAHWPGAHVVLRGLVEDRDVELSVESGGTVAVTTAADEDVVRPAGDLRLAAAMCDELILKVTPEQTLVRARKHGVVLPE